MQMRLTEAGTDDAGIRLQRPEKYEPLPDDASLMQVRTTYRNGDCCCSSF